MSLLNRINQTIDRKNAEDKVDGVSRRKKFTERVALPVATVALTGAALMAVNHAKESDPTPASNNNGPYVTRNLENSEQIVIQEARSEEYQVPVQVQQGPGEIPENHSGH